MTQILDAWPIPEFTPRPIQITALEWIADEYAKGTKYFFVQAPVGCHLAGTGVLMFDGSIKPVESIKVDDWLMGPDSAPRQVIEVHSGQERMYTIQPTKGDSFVVNENHILSLITTPANRSGFDGKRVINISVKDYLQQSNDFKRNVKLYRSDGIVFSNRHILPIDPYFLGLLLGDGSLTRTVCLTTTDNEIKEEIYEQANNYDLNVRVSNAVDFYFTTGQRGGDPSTRIKNQLLEQIRSLGLFGKNSSTKFIPQQYKTSSRTDRLQLLAGLLDTDGGYTGVFNIVSKSRLLANDIKFIARSLGFAANEFTRTVNGAEYFDITISGYLDQIPTRLKRKRATPRQQKKRVTVTSFEVVPYGIDTYHGFSITGDNLFLLEDFTIVHNSGKSLIGTTAAKWIADQSSLNRHSYILTPQRILQKQYEESFSKDMLASLYGKSNYQCNPRATTCDIGSILQPRCKSCPYNLAKITAKQTNNTVLNYSIALLAFKYTKIFDKRPLIVLDECHTAEEYLTEIDAATITSKRATKYGVRWEYHERLEDFYNWTNNKYLPKVDEYVMALESEVEHLLDNDFAEPTSAELKQLKELSSTQEHMDKIREVTLRAPEYVNQHFVFVHDKETKKFKRLYGGYNFKRILEPYGENFLLMSSTILNYRGYCQDLGINPEQSAYIDLSSEFEPENRPVYYMPQCKMNAAWNKNENGLGRKKMVNKVEEILQMHKEDSGIIHTGNFAIAQWLVEHVEFSTPHKIFHHNPGSGDDRGQVINAFQQYTKPAILISPSITEGLDLKDDLARFAIIVKVPFGFLGDQWIKKRMNQSQEWYQRRALIDIIQGAGRVVRSKNDWGNTYILDQSFGYLFNRTQDFVPKWWKDAYKVAR